MDPNASNIARVGSNTSTSTSSTIDSSSHKHMFTLITSIPNLPSLHSWSPVNHRHERIAAGALSMGMAVMTREMMEMHIKQAPDVRGMLDCLPVANNANTGFIGWRQKLNTWPKTPKA